MTDISASVVSQPISASVSGSGSIAASVSASAISVSVAGGIGPQGPTGATGSNGTGGAANLSDDTPLSPGAASAGTSSTASRSDHRHAAPAIGDISGLQAAIDGKQPAGSYAASSHTHSSSQIGDFATAVAAAAPATTNASLLTSGTLDSARLPTISYTALSNVPTSFAPSSHASSHASGGSDAVTLAASQITGLPTAGTGSTNYCVGNDSRLSDSRTPTGTAGGDLTGTYPNPTIAAGAVTESDLANAVRNLIIHQFLLMGG